MWAGNAPMGVTLCSLKCALRLGGEIYLNVFEPQRNEVH
jgi:hypothetical protein